MIKQVTCHFLILLHIKWVEWVICANEIYLFTYWELHVWNVSLQVFERGTRNMCKNI